MKAIRPTVVALALWPLSAFAQGTITVRPEVDGYTVAPGAEFPVTVVIEAADPINLFSYGIRLDYDPSKLMARAVDPVIVPLPIDFNGVEGAGALVDSGRGWVAVKGTVDISKVPLQNYAGNVLATFVFRDVSGVLEDTSDLQISLFNTLGASETIFVDGLGASLDDRITFRPGLIKIVPEPSTVALLLAGGSLLIGRLVRKETEKNRRQSANRFL